ncbi:MAG TPA: thiamine-phosphate kinase [Bryobacteraceae bacterium]|nr:thiamine-phosphate kinase [Bryobacteraceae bacterium]
MNELDLVDKIRRLAGKSSGIVLGIGDDCAIYRPKAGEELLFTADQLIEGIHFCTGAQPAAIGERALARSLSDIAAMGGEPRFCLVSLGLPEADDSRIESWIEAFFRGLLRLARRTRTALAGGDLARSNQIHCDVMVCGSAPRGRALRRDGARPGDALWVSGRLGKSWERRIEPRLALGLSLRGRATSCIDLSDGLALDLHRLCLASRVSAEVDRLPVAKGSSIERALHEGEDYELLFTLPAGKRGPKGTTRIGTMVRGKTGAISFQGSPIEPRGYDHFAGLR